MVPASRAALFLVFLLLPGVAHMSQVDYHEIPHDLKGSVRRAKVIVLARDSGKTKTFREKVFPKSTHFQKKKETVYREFSKQVEIIRVVKPGAKLAPGSRIDVWCEPAMVEGAVRIYHEQGLAESPSILQPQPRSKPKGGEVVLFLEPYQGIYKEVSGSTAEGKGALDEIEDLVHGAQNPTLWYMEDRSAFHQDGTAVVIGEDGELFRHVVENKGKQKVRELVCHTRLDQKTLAQVRKLVEKTDWKKLEFKGTLVPDETRPFLYIGLKTRCQWMIEPAPKPGPASPEAQAYQRILAIAAEHCQAGKWNTKDPKTINFSIWPARIKEITQ